MLRRREPKRIRDCPDGCLSAGEELLRLSYPARDEVGMRRKPGSALERLGKRRLGYSKFIGQLRDPIVFAGMLGHAPGKLREALRRLGRKHPRRFDNRHQKVKRGGLHLRPPGGIQRILVIGRKKRLECGLHAVRRFEQAFRKVGDRTSKPFAFG